MAQEVEKEVSACLLHRYLVGGITQGQESKRKSNLAIVRSAPPPPHRDRHVHSSDSIDVGEPSWLSPFRGPIVVLHTVFPPQELLRLRQATVQGMQEL